MIVSVDLDHALLIFIKNMAPKEIVCIIEKFG